MSQGGVRGFANRNRLTIRSVAVVALVAAGAWLSLSGPGRGAPSEASLQQRLDADLTAVEGHRLRLEARLRLLMLGHEVAAGRAADAMRPAVDLVERRLQLMGSALPPERRLVVERELAALALELGRSDARAAQRLRTLHEALDDSAGPGRQGRAD